MRGRFIKISHCNAFCYQGIIFESKDDLVIKNQKINNKLPCKELFDLDNFLANTTELIQTFTEAIEFIGNNNVNNFSNNNYLFLDIIEGINSLQGLLKHQIRDSEIPLVYKETEQLTLLLNQVLNNDESDFDSVKTQFYLWREITLFNIGEKYLHEDKPELAKHMYNLILEGTSSLYYSLASFRIGDLNKTEEPMLSFKLLNNSFRTNKEICKIFLDEKHPSYNYVYKEVEEYNIKTCPLCDQESKPYYCAEPVFSIDYAHYFNPFRVWMHCSACDHIFAFNYPINLSNLISEDASVVMTPRTSRLPLTGDKLKGILKYAKGNKLLDVGVGGGELLAVANEFMLEVTGIELMEKQAQYISNLLGVKVFSCDFLEFSSIEKFDIIALGDVLEHVTDPKKAIRNADDLLSDDGLLWISTPNFRSAYSQLVKFDDPMWKECWHLNYFSYYSLKTLLENNNFKILDYKMSHHYNGSMEVIATKK